MSFSHEEHTQGCHAISAACQEQFGDDTDALIGSIAACLHVASAIAAHIEMSDSDLANGLIAAASDVKTSRK